MMILILQRDLATPNETLGWLSVNGRKWPSIERPWKDNIKGISCVPPGEYRLERHDSEAHPKAWALVNPALSVYHWPADVPRTQQDIARTVVLIHPANWASELRGCIALGKDRTKGKDGYWMVTSSRDAINELRSALNGQLDLRLIIQAGGSQES